MSVEFVELVTVDTTLESRSVLCEFEINGSEWRAYYDSLEDNILPEQFCKPLMYMDPEDQIKIRKMLKIAHYYAFQDYHESEES